MVLVCDPSRRDLGAFRRGAHFRAKRGGHGEGSQRHGANAAVLEVAVPAGTVAEGALGASELTRWDLTEPGQRATVAHGGPGGKGNKRFAGSTRQAPRFAERGLPGEEGWLELRLKLMADAGLVGLPNAGKSSLLARLTRAAPRVADYPFTTLEPVLGTIDAGDRQLVLADIPGLIEGASAGAGLGHEFLAHVERCRLLVHVVELAPADGGDPAANYATVEAELREHGGGLAALPRLVALSKADLLSAEAVAAAEQEWRARAGAAVIATSAATGRGLGELRAALLAGVPEQAVDALPAVEAEHHVYRPGADDGFRVQRTAERGFRVEGRGVERLLARHDLDNEEALRYLEERLRDIGVIKALQAAGFRPGDDVEIAGTVFELDPGAPLR